MNNNETTIARVTVKSSEFILPDSELCFAIVNENFTSARINTNNMHFWYVIGALPLKYVIEVKDIIKTPPTNNRYVKLK